MNDSPEPIIRRKLAHEVEGRLAAAIASGEFAPGAQLPSERALMARFGVGRPSIREAMQALHQQNLIRIVHGERARVVQPTASDLVQSLSAGMLHLLGNEPGGLDDLKEARTLFEVGLARIAAERATEQGIYELEAAMERCRAERGHGAAFVAADMAFHRQIAALSGNRLLAAVSAGMLEWLTKFKRDMVSVRGADRVTVAEHERITAAIASRNPQVAGAAMAEHMSRANALYAVLAARESRAVKPARTTRRAPPRG